MNQNQSFKNQLLVADMLKHEPRQKEKQYVFRVEPESGVKTFEEFTKLFPDFIQDLKGGSTLHFAGKAMFQQTTVAQFIHYLFEDFGVIPYISFEGNPERAGQYLKAVVKEWI